MKKHTKRNLSGFTLIELLVVVLIISILSAIAVPQYTKAVARARLSEQIVQGRALLDAMNRYKMATGENWTSGLSMLDIEIPNQWVCNENVNYCTVHNSKVGTQLEVVEYHTNFISLFCLADKTSDLGNKTCRSFTGKDAERETETKKYYLIYQ